MADPANADHDITEPGDALYAALGRLVFDFGQLEESIRHALLSIFNGSDEARVVLLGLSLRQLIERFSVLYAPFRYEAELRRVRRTPSLGTLGRRGVICEHGISEQTYFKWILHDTYPTEA